MMSTPLNPGPSNLGYLVFEASDLPRWQAFAVEILGLQEAAHSTAQALALRIDHHEQRVLIERGPGDDLVAAGWALDTEYELEQLVAHIKRAGLAVEPGNHALAARRCVKSLYTCTDPNGIRHELYVGPAMAPMDQPFRSRVLKSHFVAGQLGVGHYVGIAHNKADTHRFYHEVLGLRVSDYIVGEVAPGGPLLDATFYHSATGRHHSAAIAEIPMPKKIHHFMVEVADMNDVGLAYHRCVKAGVPLMMGLGHHPNDGMFSFYAVTPSGFGVEVGWGGAIIDDSRWEVRTYSRLSDWGHEMAHH